jgi:hypothetical protein
VGKRKHTFSYVVQWLLIIAVLAICARVFFRPVPAPDRKPEDWRSWEGFYALSYGSIRHGATGIAVSPELLGEHFKALRRAGYKTVTPDDLARYFDGRHALPEKALLLMFEGGRKDSMLNVTPLLRESGFVAAACINTGACESGDRFHLTGSELKDLARQPHWSLGSMGHQAMTHLSQDPKVPTELHFLSGRKYENGVTEDDIAFVMRVMQDYATSANFLGSLTGRSTPLFLYPYTDRGIGRDADPLAGRTNRMAVELVYRLAFVDGREPFNGAGGDRYALTRLRVDGQMTAPALLVRLARSKPHPRTPNSPVESADWTFSPRYSDAAARQEAQASSEGVQLQAGKAAWIKGSDGWTNSEISAKIRFSPGAIAGIYTRYAGPEQCLYLSVAGTGIRLQERSKSGNHVTVLDYKTTLEPSRDYSVRLRIKRNRAFVFMEGRPVGGPAPVTAIEGHGKSGIGSNVGTSIFSAVSAGPLPRVFVVGNRYRSLPAAVRESALAFLLDLTISENQPQTSEGSVCIDEQQAEELVAAAAEGVEPIPLLNTLVPPDTLSSRRCTKLNELPTLKTLIRRLGLRGIGLYKPYELAERPVALIRVLQAEEVRDWMVASKDTRQETIVVEGGESDVARAIGLLLHNIPPQRLVGSVERADLPPGVGRAVHSRSPE